jgi:hypothetical protein
VVKLTNLRKGDSSKMAYIEFVQPKITQKAEEMTELDSSAFSITTS